MKLFTNNKFGLLLDKVVLQSPESLREIAKQDKARRKKLTFEQNYL